MNKIDLSKVLKCFKLCDMTMKDFAEQEGLKVGTLYQISKGQRTSDRLYDYIINCLERDYSEEFEKIKIIIREVG